ncbi:4-phosphopantetheinyl transferase family protein [Burkholderia sp. Ac-20345]|nr:4-phosphopantetheinyl transferase family protein [Burkholderia sp. Ac-20345]
MSIEPVRAQGEDGLQVRMLPPSEHTALSGSREAAPNAVLTGAWCVNATCAKAAGTRLWLDFRHIDIGLDDAGSAATPDGRRWHLRQIDAGSAEVDLLETGRAVRCGRDVPLVTWGVVADSRATRMITVDLSHGK